MDEPRKTEMDEMSRTQKDESNHAQYGTNETEMDEMSRTQMDESNHIQYGLNDYHSWSCHSHRGHRNRRWDTHEHMSRHIREAQCVDGPVEY